MSDHTHDHHPGVKLSDLDLGRDVYNRKYWEAGQEHEWGGYAADGFGAYRDFPVHWTTFNKLIGHMRAVAPKADHAIEIGPARGYIGWRLEAAGYRYTGLECSPHCWHTRAVEDIQLCNVEQAPWPVDTLAPYESRFAFSVASLEHISKEGLKTLASELARIAPYGLHGITVDHDPNDIDKTHDLGSIMPLSEWAKILPPGHVAVDKEELERGPITVPHHGAPGLKLNLGSCTVMWHQGWEHVDILPIQQFAQAYGFKFRQHDISTTLPYDSDSVRFITFHHSLEHFTYDVGLKILKECYRVLKRGGILRVSVPDAEKLIKAYTDGTLGQWDEVSATSAQHTLGARKLWELMMGGHSAIYDHASLKDAFRQAGFQTVTERGFRDSASEVIVQETMDSLPSLSVYVEGQK